MIGGGLMPRLTLAVMHVEGDLQVQLGGDRDLRVPLGGDCVLPAHSEGGVPLALDNMSQETGAILSGGMRGRTRFLTLMNPVDNSGMRMSQHKSPEESTGTECRMGMTLVCDKRVVIIH